VSPEGVLTIGITYLTRCPKPLIQLINRELDDVERLILKVMQYPPSLRYWMANHHMSPLKERFMGMLSLCLKKRYVFLIKNPPFGGVF